MVFTVATTTTFFDNADQMTLAVSFGILYKLRALLFSSTVVAQHAEIDKCESVIKFISTTKRSPSQQLALFFANKWPCKLERNMLSANCRSEAIILPSVLDSGTVLNCSA